jgi:hypothetical protein
MVFLTFNFACGPFGYAFPGKYFAIQDAITVFRATSRLCIANLICAVQPEIR